MAAPTRVAAVVALAAVVHAGCSGPCKQVARAREAAAVRPEPAAGPHLRLRVPFATLNARIAEAVAARPPTPVRLSRWSLVPANPMPGLSAAVVGDLAVVVRSVRLGPAAPGYVHVEVEAELLVGAIAVAVVGVSTSSRRSNATRQRSRSRWGSLPSRPRRWRATSGTSSSRSAMLWSPSSRADLALPARRSTRRRTSSPMRRS